MAETTREFVLTDDHRKLLSRMYVGWQDCETGAPEIDPKRPYGNSFVAQDVAEILDWPLEGNEDDRMPDEQIDRALTIHYETQYALQILLATGQSEPGRYVRTEEYNTRSWRRA